METLSTGYRPLVPPPTLRRNEKEAPHAMASHTPSCFFPDLRLLSGDQVHVTGIAEAG
jgi:hypothetical protein